MRVSRNRIGGIVLALLFCLTLQLSLFAGSPSCDCNEYDPDTQTALWEACMIGDCGGVDVPVSGNIWVLMVAGAVLLVVSKGYFKKKEEEV